MKIIYVPFTIAFLFVISGCNKDITTLIPNGQLDTLQAGWKKIIVDTSEAYSDIFFINNTTGYLVGSKTYKSTDGGLNWSPISNQSFANLAGTSNGNIFFAGGGNGLYKLANGTGPLIKVKESVAIDADVFFVDNDNGYYIEGSNLYNSTDGGANWVKVTTTGLGSNILSTLYFSNKNTGWIAGSNTVFKTDGSASNWVAASFTGTVPSSLFTSVFATTNNSVYAMANNGYLYKSTNGGTTFSYLQSFDNGVGGYFGDIYFFDSNSGYVSGSKWINKTIDGGIGEWSPAVALGDIQVVEIYFTDTNHGWACGTKGTVLVYNN